MTKRQRRHFASALSFFTNAILMLIAVDIFHDEKLNALPLMAGTVVFFVWGVACLNRFVEDEHP